MAAFNSMYKNRLTGRRYPAILAGGSVGGPIFNKRYPILSAAMMDSVYPEQTRGVPRAFAETFAYNGTYYRPDWEGREILVPVHTLFIPGNRAAQNLWGTDTSALATSGTNSINVTPGVYIFSMGAGASSGVGTVTGTATGATGNITQHATKRMALTVTITVAGTFVVTATVADLNDLMIERVEGQSNQNPSSYIPVDTATGVELVTDHSASSYAVQGTNTVADVATNEVSVTYVDNAAGAFFDFDAAGGGTASGQTVGKKYVVSGQAKVNTGSVDVTTANATADAAATITSTTYVDFTLIAVADSATTFRTIMANMSAGEVITFKNLSLREATNGFKQWDYLNPHTVTAGVVDPTGAAATPLFPKRTTKEGKSRSFTIKERLYKPWETGEVVAVGARRMPTTWATDFTQQFYWQCTVAGTTHATTEPTWTTSLNDTVSDNAVTWKAVGYYTNRGALFEPLAENLFLQSQNLDTAPNTITLGVSAQGAGIAPDGTNTANKLTDDSSTGTGSPRHAQSLTVASGAVTASIYAKADQLGWLAIRHLNFDNNGYTFFDLTNGVVGVTDADVTPHIEVLANGWVRCGITFTTTSDLTGDILLYLSDADNDVIVDLDGTSSILLWGGQVEAGSVMTSYIPTTTAAVTRATQAGSLTFDISNWSNSNALALCDFSIAIPQADIDTTSNIFSLQSGGVANGLRFAAAGTFETYDGTTILGIGDWNEPANGIIRGAMAVNSAANRLEIFAQSNTKAYGNNNSAYDGTIGTDVIVIGQTLVYPTTIHSFQIMPSNYLATVDLDDDSERLVA